MNDERRFRRGALCALLLAATTMAACDHQGPGMDGLLELSRSHARWTRVGPDDYTYAIRRRCFCGPEVLGPVRVTVSAGEVVERAYVETGAAVPDELGALFPAVDGLFGVLFDAYDRGAFRIDVTFDPETGVPLDFFIDYDEQVADEELGFEVVGMVTPM